LSRLREHSFVLTCFSLNCFLFESSSHKFSISLWFSAPHSDSSYSRIGPVICSIHIRCDVPLSAPWLTPFQSLAR
jgi:hypothetical protein